MLLDFEGFLFEKGDLFSRNLLFRELKLEFLPDFREDFVSRKIFCINPNQFIIFSIKIKF